MFTAMVKTSRRRGFTLLEITLAAAILGLMSLAIYRFVQTNIAVLRISAAESVDEARYTGLLDLLTTQWQELPTNVGALGGEPFKFNDRSRDEVVWVCGAGPGLLTRYAGGEFSVRMRLRPMKDGGDKLQLGFLRRPRETAEGSDEGESWVPLIDDVRGLRIRYFDVRLNAWVERWTDSGTLPRLIEVIVERPNRANWQAIIALGRTPWPSG
jgi:prepilin-type N-terminal cleavage/methylation domain-containing protein